MKADVLKIFSDVEIQTMKLDGIVQEVNGYYFPSDSALTMSERAGIVSPHAPKHALASHLLASWVFCCRFEPPSQMFFAAQPGKRLKVDGKGKEKVFNNALVFDDVVTVDNLLLTSPLRTFIDVLMMVQNFRTATVTELHKLERLSGAHTDAIWHKIQSLHFRKRAQKQFSEYRRALGALNPVHVVHAVNPSDSVQ